ncbi:MAG: STAS domain-containing protein [Spirochaetales bacterium]|nr:STAS domain-containing protein [Spirochaetales bacterium]MCF7938287.1 STAS domain-containing protein [Spirochaetales bacterium]
MSSTFEHYIKTFNEKNNRLNLEHLFVEDREHTLILYLKGDLDTNNSYPFIDLFETLNDITPNPEKIVVDCKGINYISSTGIGSFTTILIKCRKRGISFFLSRVPKKVNDVLSMLGFSSYFSILEDPFAKTTLQRDSLEE